MLTQYDSRRVVVITVANLYSCPTRLAGSSKEAVFEQQELLRAHVFLYVLIVYGNAFAIYSGLWRSALV